MPKQKINPNILAAALQGLEAQRQRIEAHIAEVKRMLDSRPGSANTPEPPARKRRMSAAHRRRIAAAQKRRWAAFRKAQASAEKLAAKPQKRRISAAGRKARAAAKTAQKAKTPEQAPVAAE